jgi:hypothetical protein
MEMREFTFAEFDFCLGVEDVARAEKAIKGMAGKRFMYQAPRRAANA